MIFFKNYFQSGNYYYYSVVKFIFRFVLKFLLNDFRKLGF